MDEENKIKVKKGTNFNFPPKAPMSFTRKMVLIGCVIVGIIGVRYSIFHFDLLHQKKSSSMMLAESFYSITDGEWKSNIWSYVSNSGPNCNNNPGCNYNGQGIFINHNITSSACAKLTMTGGGITTVSGKGKLTVFGDLEIKGGSILRVQYPDSVIVNGDLNMNGSSQVVVYGGYFKVNGSVNLSGGSNVCVSGSGSISYTGTLKGDGWNNCTLSLPIELIYFNANFNNGLVDFKWATATETNNEYFTIERSQDGREFTEILRVPGAGNSATQKQYSATDDSPLRGTSYYRLRQTDYDGKFVNVAVQQVEYGKVTGEGFLSIKSVAPNPFSDHFAVNYSLAQAGVVEVQIVNTSGQLVHKATVHGDQGLNTYSFTDVNGLAKGLYIVNLISGGHAGAEKVIKR